MRAKKNGKALDLDTPDDLRELAGVLGVAPGRAPATARELERLGRLAAVR